MTADEAVVKVIDALETVGIRYMVVGSLASNFHGIPRSTRDAELAGSPFISELFVRGDDAHDRERFARRLRVRLLDRDAYVASA